jgi:hypothetical protein
MTTGMARSLAERWATDGFVPVVDVLTSAEADRARAAFDELERQAGRDTAEVRLLDRQPDSTRGGPESRLSRSSPILLGSPVTFTTVHTTPTADQSLSRGQDE